MAEHKQKILEAITRVLDERMKVLIERKPDVGTSIEAYTIIFNVVTEIMTQTKAGMTNEAMNYIAQQLYDCVTFNEHGDLDPNIFTQRAKLEKISTKELVVIATIFSGNILAAPVIKEIKQRS